MKPIRAITLASATALACGSLFLISCASSGFDTADTDDDGAVTKAEFERYLLETIYAEADDNRDSKITFAEWKEANPDAKESKFKQPDTNRDGSVTPAEVKAHFAKEGTIDDLFKQADTDKSGTVTQAELEVYITKLRAKA